jgi:ketosteroid isomerase-like protein
VPAREVEATLRRMYAAFDARDVDAIAGFMHPDVDWPNAWEGGRLRGRADVLAYWRRQFEAIDPRVTPERLAERDDGRIAVDVHQVVRSLEGEVLADRRVVHVYSLRDGLVERMDVEDG